MKTLIKTTLAIALVALTTTATFAKSKKVNETEERTVESFNGIVTSGAFKVFLTQGDKESLTIETKDFCVKDIITEVKDNKLHIIINNRVLKGRQKVNIYLTFKNIESIHNHGVASIKCNDRLSFSELDILNSGVSHIKIKGEAYNLKATNSGVGRINTKKLTVKTATVTHTGVGRTKVNAQETTNIYKAGIGRVSNHGKSEVAETKRKDTGICVFCIKR